MDQHKNGINPLKQKAKDVFAFALYRFAEAHYLDFVIATPYALSEERIRLKDASEKLSFREDDYRRLLVIFRRAKRKESVPLASEYIRLVLEDKQKTTKIVVDQFGVFRQNNDPPYQMDPLSFLCLSRFLEEIASKLAKRRGIRRLYDLTHPD